jgi:hypothetical protein
MYDGCIFVFLNYQFFIPAVKNNALEHEGFIFIKIFSNGYVHWMAMVDGISGMVKEENHGIQISVKYMFGYVRAWTCLDGYFLYRDVFTDTFFGQQVQ